MTRKNALLGISFFTFISLGMNSSILNIAWKHMEETFDVGLDWVGVLLTTATMGYLTAAFLNGRLVARVGVGRLLLIGGGTAMIGLLGFSVAPVWAVLLIVAFVASFGGGLIDAGLNTYLSANHGPSAMNWLHACFGIGATLAPSLVTLVVVTLDQSWRVGYLVLLGVEVIVFGAILLTLPHWRLNGDDAVSSAEGQPQSSAGILETLRAPLVIMGLLVFFIYGGVEMGTGQLSNSLLVDGRGVSQSTAGFWVSIYWGSFTVGRMLSGMFATRVSIPTLLRGSMVFMVIGASLYWLNIGGQTGFFGLALLGFAQAPLFATLTSDTPRRVGARYAPNTIGFQLGVCGLGGAVLPGMTAALAVHAGLEVIGLVMTALAVVVLFIYEMMLRQDLRRQHLPASAD